MRSEICLKPFSSSRQVCNVKLMGKPKKPAACSFQPDSLLSCLCKPLKATFFSPVSNVDICLGGVRLHHNRGIHQLSPQLSSKVHLQPEWLGMPLCCGNRGDRLLGMCGLSGVGCLRAFHEQCAGKEVCCHGRPGILRWARALKWFFWFVL